MGYATVQNILTVDVEDYFHVTAFEDRISRDRWDGMECRVEMNTRRVLDLVEEAGVRATFFVLGWVGERYPGLVAEIAARGHEVASHGSSHRMVTDMTPEEFREDLVRSRSVLEDASGAPVRGFRAPTFSITPGTEWAWRILAEEGFEYDSSTFPVRHDRYGNPNGERFAHVQRLGDGVPNLVEFPLTTLRLLGSNLPAAGGGYLRLLPTGLVRAAIRQSNRHGYPAVIYVHPWELDPDQPRIQVSTLTRFRHYVNLGKTAERLRGLLNYARFGTVREYLDEWKLRTGVERSAGKSEGADGSQDLRRREDDLAMPVGRHAGSRP